MVAMAVARRPAEHRHDDLRPEGAHHRHDVAQDRVLHPVRVRLLGRLGEAEIVRAREVLPAAVEPPRREQLLGADHPELRSELVADQVLPTVAARQGEIRRLDVLPARQPGEELGVLVVRVSADHQHAPRHVQSRHGLAQRDCAALLG
jgi:hypothetical protein